ncbi:hypothetical protein V5F72_23970 [Xanthobacter flavus]|uniref:hypothetical protein n=1 Tax=Xanthobacter flavus TaxID=281 RepID=UPI00372BCF8B
MNQKVQAPRQEFVLAGAILTMVGATIAAAGHDGAMAAALVGLAAAILKFGR